MDYNYASELDFDRAASVTLAKAEAARKLAAWEDRLTYTDYPAEWQVDLMNGDFVTLSLVDAAANPLVWTGKDYDLGNHSVSITFVDGSPTVFAYTGTDSEASFDAVTEGTITLDNETRVRICDPDLRTGTSELKITYDDIARGQITTELDNYCHAHLGVISDTSIKGHKVVGTWRLAEVRKLDSDNPDSTKVVLVYKKGYAQTLEFGEAIILNMVDYKQDNSSLVVKFPNIDPRYTQAAKDEYSGTSILTNPVFGGVRYDGYWSSIKMETSEVSSRYADLEDAASIVWFLTKHNNTNLYFRYYDSGSESIRGHYFKWDATEETMDDLFTGIQFDDDGYVVESGGNTLNEPVIGRNVRVWRTERDERDRLYDIEVQIQWSKSVVYGGGGSPIITFGEPLEVTTFVAKYVGYTLPTDEQAVGEYLDIKVGDTNPLDGTTIATAFDLTGRQKTVTRIQNANVTGGKFNYDLFETKMTAPINGPTDDWFYMGGAALVERDKKVFYSAPTDADGNGGWQPVDSNPAIHTVELCTQRPKHIKRLMKFFVRYPTPDDLNAAGITKLTDKTTYPAEFPTTVEELETVPIITYADSVKQIGRDLFALERIVTELGTVQRDVDNETLPDFAQWITSSGVLP